MDKNLLLQDVLSHLQTDLEQASLAALSADFHARLTERGGLPTPETCHAA